MGNGTSNPEKDAWKEGDFGPKYVDPYIDFWLEWLGARETDEGGTNRRPISKECKDRLKCILRAISWVESKHGTGTGNQPKRDPMQVGNPNDDAHKSITGQKPQPGPKREGPLPGVPDYKDLPDRMKNPLPNDGPKAPEPFKNPDYTYPPNGHDSETFKPSDSFFWGIMWYILRTNQRDGLTPPVAAWNFRDCSMDRLIDGAVAYNGGGDAEYRNKIMEALKLSGCL
jgi:hypothetical protein